MVTVLLYAVGLAGVVIGWAMVGSVPGTLVLVAAGVLLGWSAARSPYRSERPGSGTRAVTPPG